MKFSIKYILASLAIITAATAISQSTKPVTLEMWVAGTCSGCEKRIESALDVKGIIFAEYTLKEHTLEVVFKPHKISEKQIHQLVNDAGHDTKKGLASDEAYGKVDDCCKYRTHECSKDH